MRNLYLIISFLLSFTACQWDLDKFDLDGNVYNCEETCVNGVCDELKNVCVCNDGWGGKDCDVEVVTFEKTIDIANDLGDIQITIDESNNYIIIANEIRENGERFTHILKFNRYGILVWSRRIDGGSVISIITYAEYYLLAINSELVILDLDGNIIDKSSFGNRIDRLLLYNEQLFVFSRNCDTYTLFQINNMGSINWQKDWELECYGDFRDVQINDKDLLITSIDYGRGYYGNRIFYASLSLETDVNYFSYYNGRPTKIKLLDNNDFFLGGNTATYSQNNNDILLLRIDQVGNILWEKNYGGSENEWLTSLQFTFDGNYILGGVTYSSDHDVSVNNGQSDFWLIKVDLNGNILWEKTYGTEGYENLGDMTVTPDGGFIMIGTKSNYETYIVKTDADGNI